MSSENVKLSKKKKKENEEEVEKLDLNKMTPAQADSIGRSMAEVLKHDKKELQKEKGTTFSITGKAIRTGLGSLKDRHEKLIQSGKVKREKPTAKKKKKNNQTPDYVKKAKNAK